ncbi:alkaline phosphatase PafA [Pontibacter lucknowensis]|uniref:Type I phosphodiesterase / nucleotide pyrophosphatase n=1 Tax=Pontibacter lucknowensis TaxID=1077936 RepID=A0A1N6V2S5_9BACT|nr:alkaline phosphatase PafA [Pontibacter lucknowensis]SIQ72088.1 Type I phosphodiesterase / nucleotide pyrophosphatase [Pontibacter lucknowensis]
MKLSGFKSGIQTLVAAVLLIAVQACTTTNSPSVAREQGNQPVIGVEGRPKLIVGIVVDQMRYDFLYRYWDKYSEGGFKRLVRQGFNFKNNQYSYVPTYTGPGHASVYTGSVPALNGIIGNSWYDRTTGKSMYCVEDRSVKTVGSTSDAGLMSPRNLLTTTITDELRLSNNMQSKVIGVALKDRGSILPAGHTANGAYWFDSPSGNWITSTFYADALPNWVQEFNNQKHPDKLLSEVWNTLLPIEQYTESTADDMDWERALPGEERPVFPHNIPAIRGKDYELIRSIPAGNTLTTEFAKAALRGENLGKGNFTDFLALSYSTPDYTGHSFGPNSIEVQDVYLRLDREIEELINLLENEIGKDNVLIFLTADHGAAHVPAYMESLNIPAGIATSGIMRDSLEQHLTKLFGKGRWVERYTNQQVYLDRKTIEGKKLTRIEVQEAAANYVMRFDGVARAITGEAIQRAGWAGGMMSRLESGYNAQRSGDVIVVLQPGWFEGYGSGPQKGTTHGSYSNYDTHVPLVWYGWKVKPGESSVETAVADIAPTIASWLYIQEPNGSVGRPLQEFMK